jgi:hypothetical protein
MRATGLRLELGAEVGVGDPDEGTGALTDAVKSICPPTPLYRRDPIESAQTWPDRST